MKYLLKFKLKFKPVHAVFLCMALIAAESTAWSVPVPSYAAQVESPSTSTQQKLDETNERLDELKRQQSALNSDLVDLNDKLTDAAASLTDIQNQIETTEADIDNLNTQIEQALKYEEEQYAAMKLRIKYMYENGSGTTAFTLLLEAGNMEEFLTRAEYIAKISEYDRNMLEEYHANYAALVEARQTLVDKRASLASLEANAKSEQSNIQQLVNDTQSKIDTSSVDISEAEALALQYEKQIQEEEIARQEAERKAAEEAARKAAEAKGVTNTSDGLTLIQQETSHNAINYTDHELAMLAAIVECEAANQPYESKLAVASVVINRMNNPRWPDTMTEVLYQENQFTPVKSGRFAIVLARGANESCTQAALDVLTSGATIDAVFFHVVREGETGGTVIGDHIFF